MAMVELLTIEQGVRMINGPVAGGIGLVAAGGMLVYSGGTAAPVAVPLATTSIAIIIGSDVLERNINNEQ
ncbi:hypothetical protein MKL26_05790 [Streptococcus suis]|nr:hypothetical protein [Streptococcus suis]